MGGGEKELRVETSKDVSRTLLDGGGILVCVSVQNLIFQKLITFTFHRIWKQSEWVKTLRMLVSIEISYYLPIEISYPSDQTDIGVPRYSDANSTGQVWPGFRWNFRTRLKNTWTLCKRILRARVFNTCDNVRASKRQGKVRRAKLGQSTERTFKFQSRSPNYRPS